MTSRTISYTITDSDGGPALVDFDIWQGYNYPPAIWGPENENGAPFPTAGSEFILTINFLGSKVSKSSKDPLSGFTHNLRTSELTWTYTEEESRLIALGPNTPYEVERRVAGDKIAFIAGIITGKGGNNND